MMEKFTVMPHLFLVKINKEKQRAFKERISEDSPFFMPLGFVHNSRNLECGEIVQIGENMLGTDQWLEYRKGHGIYGWEKCKVGDTLIFHWSIESPVGTTGKDRHYYKYFVYEDEVFNYFVVDYSNVRGFYDGITVTPSPDFVFLKNIPAYPNEDEVDGITGNKVKKSEGGIFVVTSWENSAQDIAQKSQKIQEHIESLTKSKRTPEIQIELEKMENERQHMNRKAQQKKMLPYLLAYSNRRVDRDFGQKVVENSILMCFNKACLYISNFKNKEYSYIICPVEHIGGLIIDRNLKAASMA